MGGESAGHLLVHGVQERHQAGGGCERRDEVLVIEDLLPDCAELSGREIEQGPPLEVLRGEAVREVMETDRTGTEFMDEAGRVCLRLVHRPAPYRDDELVQLASVLLVPAIARDARRSRGQQMQRGR